MISYTSRTGVWDIQAKETKLPHIKLENLVANSTIKVTCQFYGRSLSDDLGDGYTYQIQERGTNLITLTPDIGFVQGSDSWQLYTHVMLFQVPGRVGDGETTINIEVDKGDMNGIGAMMNFVLIAETVG